MEKNSSHLAGEYFVAAELYRRGFSVGLTIGNAKAIDMFAEKDGAIISIQVKAIRNRRSIGWPIKKEQVVNSNIIYVFVNLNVEDDSIAPPEYYVCTAEEVLRHIREYEIRSIIRLSDLDKGGYLEMWDKVNHSD
jgi:hypothetical protein